MFPSTYAKLSTQVLSNVAEASSAAFTAATAPTVTGQTETTEPAPDTVEPGDDHAGWESDVPADVAVGDTSRFTKTIHDEDVKRFAASSGDTNPLHLDEEFAEETRFSGRIAHGILVSGLISAALARLPGDVVYLSQDLEFLAPVEIGDRVTAACSIAEDLGNNQYRLTTTVTDGDGETVIDGEAVVLILPE
ncbi:MaoC family dehydratase [Salinibaculum rarum]|uniref:MaoC family dehydratase n=1 Tax=Salinibaculum rarum TaxID=3058903 RepID=UPI00265E411E|nr:MaoC family dehydratase [Salinibaculum sp. KK48]